mgnify:CR=1 FL=1
MRQFACLLVLVATPAFAADPAAFLCKTGAWIKLPEKHLRGQAIRAWSAAVNLPAIAVDIWENSSYNID